MKTTVLIKIFIIFVWGSCPFFKLYSQDEFLHNYSPLHNVDTAYKKQVLTILKDRYQFMVDSLSNNSSKEKRKKYQEIYDEKYKFIDERFSGNYLLWDDTITRFLNRIVEKLAKANPELSKQKIIFTNRTSIPNAVSIGEGAILFNLGLLCRLQTEGEIAFVLGHELAHDKMNHNIQKIKKNVEATTDKEVKQQIEKASKSEYNAYHQLESVFKSLSFDFNKHGRDHESEADSLGALWMARAGYNPEGSVSALGMLDSCDKGKYQEPIDYDHIFSTNDFVFKKEWLQGEEFLQWYKSKEDAYGRNNDTLKTHPDCKKRMDDVKKMYAQQPKFTGSDGSVSLKNTLNVLADFEIIQHQYEHEHYGASLYNTLHLLQHYPDNIYLKAMIGKNLYFLHKAIKDHNFSKYADSPHPYHDKNYNEYLYFINNLRSSEIATLAISYIKKNTMTPEDSQFEFASILCLSMEPEKTSLENLIADYIRTYPKTTEAKFLKDNFIQSSLKK